MKVLQVQRVVPDLVDVSTSEKSCTDLELENDQTPVKQEHRVDALAQSRNHKLQKNVTVVEGQQRTSEDAHFLPPCIALRQVDIEFTGGCEFAQNGQVVAREKTRDRV